MSAPFRPPYDDDCRICHPAPSWRYGLLTLALTLAGALAALVVVLLLGAS